MVGEKKPLVSICCITYNHENYIRDAIKGFLMQKTSFPFEIIVHDDASTDKTVDIIKEYEKKCPEVVNCIYQKENLYSKGVRGITARFIIPLAKGKYIALCEGDDCWTDPYKLQKQIDFLENNANYALCFHRVRLSYQSGFIHFPKSNRNQKETTDIVDLCRLNYIYTASCVFRNCLNGKLPKWFESASPLDWPYFVMVAQYGKVKFLNETMAVYRIHKAGIWGGTSLLYKWTQEIDMLQKLSAFLNRPDCKLAIDEAISERKKSIASGKKKISIGKLLHLFGK